jgi:thymidylate synthase ThyX
MAFAAKILADSVGPSGKRLTTFEVQYPRCIHSEIMTHRMLSKNAASSRAIPSEKLIQRVMDDPFIPIHWGKNQKGMQAEVELTLEEQDSARFGWLAARDEAVGNAKSLLALGLHKQIVNRVIEPWMWITIIVSATEWSNFFGLRCHKDAEPHFQKIAGMMLALYTTSTPAVLKAGEYHLPLVFSEDMEAAKVITRDRLMNDRATKGINIEPGSPVFEIILRRVLAEVSVGRCARVSYLTHDGRRDLREDIALFERLKNANPGHWSPFEHVGIAEGSMVSTGLQGRSGNFFGWRQFRKTFEQEHIGGPMP